MSDSRITSRAARAPYGNRFDIAAIIVAIVMVGAVVLAFAGYDTRADDWGYKSPRVGAAT